jgi:hypothetical protein
MRCSPRFFNQSTKVLEIAKLQSSHSDGMSRMHFCRLVVRNEKSPPGAHRSRTSFEQRLKKARIRNDLRPFRERRVRGENHRRSLGALGHRLAIPRAQAGAPRPGGLSQFVNRKSELRSQEKQTPPIQWRFGQPMRGQCCIHQADGDGVSGASNLPSTLPQRNDWVNSAGAPSWKIAGEHSDNHQQASHCA